MNVSISATRPPKAPANGNTTNTVNTYTLSQAMSDNAQLSTIAFSGLAFITGNRGADSFMPPGKVADFFGFQYMRDIDIAGYGHNTQFLTRVANNVLFILNDAQKEKLITLAKKQSPIYTTFAYNRFPIMSAFRLALEGKSQLNQTAIANYTSKLYELDAQLSYDRAVILGEIIISFTEAQKNYLSKMEFNNFNTWPNLPEDNALKQGMTNTEFTAVMTYSSELFSWYKGSLEADIYFCPERHGTYFGGFFMKDYPAMNNPDYFISTAVTGDKGKMFIDLLNSTQRELMVGIISEQKLALNEISSIRTEVSTELRKAQTGGVIDKTRVFSLIKRYGYLDGQISALYADRFSKINASLSATQREALIKLRDLDIIPSGAYMFSKEITYPTLPNIDYLFGKGSMPEDAGSYIPPTNFESVRFQPVQMPKQPSDQKNLIR